MKQTNLDALNVHLFETIEMLKNNSDTEASANERIDIETAKTIVDVAKVIVDGYKVKASVLGTIAKSSRNGDKIPEDMKKLAVNWGVNE